MRDESVERHEPERMKYARLYRSSTGSYVTVPLGRPMYKAEIQVFVTQYYHGWELVSFSKDPGKCG